MKHLGDDDLILHYYGEDGARVLAAEAHLRECARCAGDYDALVRTLSVVTPPEVSEAATAGDDLLAVKTRILNSRSSRSQPGLVVLVWLTSLLYPFSLQALFRSAHWAQTNFVGFLSLALALTWAFAGPFVAIFALNRISLGRGTPVYTRLLIGGSIMAAISPSLLFLLLKANWSASHVDVLLWCGANAIAAIAVLAPWPHAPSTPRLAYLHRLAASVLTVFVLAHVVNQALAFISPPAYAAMRNVMRVASQQSISYLLLIGAVAIQIVTGTAMGLKHVRAGAFGRNLQAVSGWCLAAFLLAHVFSPLLLSAPPVAPSGAAFDQFHLLATPRGAAQLPFLVLGVAAFLFHVGAYARLAALAYFAEASVRRLSYAGALVGTGVVVAVGLALCGVHF